MADNEANVISIDGKEYDPSKMTDQQKYWIMQIQDLQQKRQAAQFQLDQVGGAVDYFTNLLIQNLSDKTEKPKEKLNG